LLYREYDENLAEILHKMDIPYSPPYCNLRYGFEFLQGWRDLADEFSDTATKLVQCLRADMQKDAYIHSNVFKEKFGTLRWQGRNNLMEPFRTLFRSYVWDTMNSSQFVCEVTGKPGKLRQREGITQTLCDEEFHKRLEEEKKRSR
jgi:hypothetical protein